MRKMQLAVLLLFVYSAQTYGQAIVAIPKSNPVTAKKIAGTDLVVPIELDFVNTTAANQSLGLTVQIDNTTTSLVSRFSPAVVPSMKVINGNQTVAFGPNEKKTLSTPVYLFIDRSAVIVSDKAVFLKVFDGARLLCNIKLIIQADDQAVSLDNYLKLKRPNSNEKLYKLDYVTKVESNNNIMTVSGYKKVEAADGTKQDAFLKWNVELKRGDVFSVSEWSWVGNGFHWKPWPISLITVPFKMRPGLTWKGREFPSSATSGITNVGFNLELGRWKMDRYFSTAKKSTHKFSLGLMVAPSVEELDSVSTNGALGVAFGKTEKSKQLFLSAGLTISYSYNDISFVFVPAGVDWATSTLGKEWVYKNQRWWGFGIAISPKIFETILNK